MFYVSDPFACITVVYLVCVFSCVDFKMWTNNAPTDGQYFFYNMMVTFLYGINHLILKEGDPIN
jgi:hypothetical protein